MGASTDGREAHRQRRSYGAYRQWEDGIGDAMGEPAGVLCGRQSGALLSAALSGELKCNAKPTGGEVRGLRCDASPFPCTPGDL